MLTHKRKRRAARVAGKTLAPQAPVVLFLPRLPDDLPPLVARAVAAPRVPAARPARAPAVAARPPVAKRAPSPRHQPARAPSARPLVPPHGAERPTNWVDGKKASGAVSRPVGRKTPEGGSHPTRTERTSRVAPRSRECSNTQDRFSMGRPVDRPTSKERLCPEIGARWSASAAGPGFPVSKRRRRTSEASTPTVHPSNPCRSVRRVWVKSRPVSRSKAYTKSLSSSTSVVSARSGHLNTLINSIRESVHRLEAFLLGGVL